MWVALCWESSLWLVMETGLHSWQTRVINPSDLGYLPLQKAKQHQTATGKQLYQPSHGTPHSSRTAIVAFLSPFLGEKWQSDHLLTISAFALQINKHRHRCLLLWTVRETRSGQIEAGLWNS